MEQEKLKTLQDFLSEGKTETDYWTIGYNKNYLMMVWAGNDDNDKVKARDSKITKKIWSKTKHTNLYRQLLCEKS